MANEIVASVSQKEDALRFEHGLEAKTAGGPEFNEAPLLDQEDEEFSAGASNRGNKTLFNSNTTSLRGLKSSRDNFKLVTMKTVDQSSGKSISKLVIQDKRMSLDDLVKSELDLEYGPESDDTYRDDDASQLLDQLDFAKILGPITDPADIVTRPSISKIYSSKHLAELADETIHIIENEQENVNNLSHLMNAFLGDDPDSHLADTLKLPKYDHHLDLGEEMNEDKPEEEQDADVTQEEENTDAYSQVVSNEEANKMIPDPFFKLSEYKRDFNFGVHKTEDAEEARQLIQIALQRNEEFIRSLSSMRMGFSRAERLKTEIYRWCKEIDENERSV